MGVNDREGNTGSRNGKTPAAPQPSRWEDADSSTGVVTWGDADCDLLRRLLVNATRQKMAVSLAATADLRGVSITILDGGERPKWYANTPDGLNKRLAWLVERTA